MATTIAHLTKKSDGIYDGTFATFAVSGPISLIPNARKKFENEPDYLVIHRKSGFEFGAGWKRFSKNTGEEYLSLSMSSPEFGTIYGNLAQAPGDDPNKAVILWNSPGS